MSKRKTHDVFLAELKTKNPSIHPLEQYVNSATKIQCECAVCGHKWFVTPNSLLRGSGCPNCYGNIRKSNADFVKELSIINPNIEPLEEYRGNKKPILCRCKVCGHEWKPLPNNLLSKRHKCPQCSRKKNGLIRRKTDADFVKELHLINPDIIPLDHYTTSQKKIKCKCKKCGHVWSATPNNLLDKRSRCPNCSHASTSIVEQIIFNSFAKALGESAVKSRDRKAIGKELDILIPSYNFAIEYGAWIWHKDKSKADNEKQRLCQEKGIHLITVFEDCPLSAKKVLNGDFRLYTDALNQEKDYHTIKQIICEICDEYSIPTDIITNQWDRIIKESVLLARNRDDNEFRELLNKVNPSVLPLEPYTTTNKKIKCRCKNCGHEWAAVPSSLLRGHGCQKCARKVTGIKKTITNDEFLDRLKKINPTIQPLDQYEKGNIPIRCRCKVCGNEWSVKPHNLLQGHGCRKCARAHTTKLQSKPIRCIETGVCYKSLAEVQRETGIYGANKCAKGYQKTAGGYHWEYVKDNTKCNE